MTIEVLRYSGASNPSYGGMTHVASLKFQGGREEKIAWNSA